MKKYLLSSILVVGCINNPSQEPYHSLPDNSILDASLAPVNNTLNICKSTLRICNETLLTIVGVYATRNLQLSETHITIYRLLLEEENSGRAMVTIKLALENDRDVIKAFQGLNGFLSDESKIRLSVQLGELEAILQKDKKTF